MFYPHKSPLNVFSPFFTSSDISCHLLAPPYFSIVIIFTRPAVRGCSYTSPSSPSVINRPLVCHKQVFTVVTWGQILHLTTQHHINVHLQYVCFFSTLVTDPRLQHINSQPSIPMDVALQYLPVVPNEPILVSFSQNVGESVE